MGRLEFPVSTRLWPMSLGLRLRSPGIRSGVTTLITMAAWSMSAAACSSKVTGPTSEIGTVWQLVASLRAKSLDVSVSSETAPQTNGYFSVPSRDVAVAETRLKAFEYGTAGDADADAARISADGQPNPRASIGWISAPHFYKHEQLIVLYLGCDRAMLATLDELIGPAIANGSGCN